MKKSIFKLMSAAVALSTLASCSDDLGFGNSPILSNADMVATLTTDDDGFNPTRMGMLEVEGDNPWASKGAAGWKWVFTENDLVRVFTMESMKYQKYQLIAGANTGEGQFEITANQPELPEGTQKYAITDAQFAYGVSPMEDGTPRLTYTIPYRYTATTYDADPVTKNGVEYAANVEKLPAPFWGVAATEDVQGSNGKLLRTNLVPLTAFLRINTQTLPEGTKYIVLTTHGSVMQGDNGLEYDGFQLLTPDADDLSKVKVTDANGRTQSLEFQDNLNFWDTNATEDNGGKITDGNSEPISGTFNALLVDKKSKLAKDNGVNEEGEEVTSGGLQRLVTRDEIVIEVTQDAEVFWIPIIAQHYNNLHVLAVTKKSDKYAYKYVGTELKAFTNWTPEVGERHHLNINLYNLGEVCAHDLNAAIEKVNKANKFNMSAQNIIFVDKLVDCTHTVAGGYDHDKDNVSAGSNPLRKYPNDQILVQGKGDLVINIAEIDVTTGPKGNKVAPVLNNVDVRDNTLFVSDKNYANSRSYTYENYASEGATSKNSVKINVPAAWATDNKTEAILADLPKTNAIFAANTNFAPAAQQAAKNLRIDVHGSATEFVNGKEVREVDAEGNVVLKENAQAAITVESGFGQLNVLADTKGDVYVNGAATGQKVELTEGLFVYTNAGLNVRMDNALAKNVGFLESSNNHENYLITIGSSAMQKVGVAKDLGEGDLEANLIPNDLSLLAYWTGYALDAEAVGIQNYDNGTVYTAAQLASMGEKIGGSTTAEYKVNDLLEYIWLGGANYGWVGPQVEVDNFKFDGNNVSLLNMYMPKNEKEAIAAGMTRPIYTYDPHICCTTCGWNRPTDTTTDAPGTPEVPMTEFGLIRSIKNAGDGDEIKNVKLNDVYADGTINDVGSLVGYFEATTAHPLTLENNNVGEVRINTTGDNVGGLIGKVDKVTTLTIDHNTVGNSQYNTGYVKGNNNVAGLVGYVKEDGNGSLVIKDTDVDLAKDIEAAAANAAGLVGNAIVKESTLEDATVAAKNIKAGKNNAAGLIAELIGVNSKSYAVKVDVKENIEAGEQFAAGLVAYENATTKFSVLGADVKAGTIKSENGYVGGLVAYAPKGLVEFGCGAPNIDLWDWNTMRKGKNLENKVVVNTLASAYNVGGFIGNNANNANVYLYGYDYNNLGTSTCKNSVNITKFENTKTDLDNYFKTTGSEANSHLAGTMSNIAGKVDGKLYINESFLTVVDNLDGTMKKAVGYTHHNDQGATPSQSIRKFWGDSNGYVGFGKSGNYFIDTDNEDMGNVRNAVVGDQALNTNGFNLYKLDADYNTKSKNAPAE